MELISESDALEWLNHHDIRYYLLVQCYAFWASGSDPAVDGSRALYTPWSVVLIPQLDADQALLGLLILEKKLEVNGW